MHPRSQRNMASISSSSRRRCFLLMLISLHNHQANAFVISSPMCKRKNAATQPVLGVSGEAARELDFLTATATAAAAAAARSTRNDDFVRLSILAGEEQHHKNSDIFRDSFRRLAEWSLEDYEWRHSLFQENEAERLMEESLARMIGEDPSYVRPMDAGEQKIGPLGKLEKNAVEWLSKVIDEEGRRAKKIINTDGELVRPMDVGVEGGELGPLGFLEKSVADFLQAIRNSEKLRVQTGILLRPKDLDEDVRGPLGNLEVALSTAFRNIQDSELLRLEQSKNRGGEIVRPIDIPGLLGEFEMAMSEIVEEEKNRSKNGISRPKDVDEPGRLGEVELQALAIVRSLTDEEKERLRNIQRVLEENRPMVRDKDSILGEIESILVSIFNVLKILLVNLVQAPVLVGKVIERVTQFLESEKIAGDSRIESSNISRQKVTNDLWTEFE